MGERQLDTNVETYERKFREGYGHRYPDGHVIRFHRRILLYELSMNGGRMLDYGCGTGVYMYYFSQHGFEPYGCDVSETAIAECKKMMPHYQDHFRVVPSVPDLSRYFKRPFDFVFSNQVLYFLNDDDIMILLRQFFQLMRPGAVLFASMIATTNYYSRFAVGHENGLSRVELRGRLNDTLFVNFKTKDQVIDLFSAVGFKKLHLGHYGALIREDEGTNDHHLFVGGRA